MITVSQGITLAQETGLPLWFLHVVNTDLASTAGGEHQDAVAEHLYNMGCSVVGVAKTRAQSRGIESQGYVRQGEVEAEMVSLCRDLDATYLVLGRTQSGKESIYDPIQFAQLIERIGAQTETVVVFR